MSTLIGLALLCACVSIIALLLCIEKIKPPERTLALGVGILFALWAIVALLGAILVQLSNLKIH